MLFKYTSVLCSLLLRPRVAGPFFYCTCTSFCIPPGRTNERRKLNLFRVGERPRSKHTQGHTQYTHTYTQAAAFSFSTWGRINNERGGRSEAFSAFLFRCSLLHVCAVRVWCVLEVLTIAFPFLRDSPHPPKLSSLPPLLPNWSPPPYSYTHMYGVYTHIRTTYCTYS